MYAIVILLVQGRRSLEPKWTRTLVSWNPDLDYWGQDWGISRLLYELMQHIPLVGDPTAIAVVAATAKP